MADVFRRTVLQVLEFYKKTGSITKTITILGYPKRRLTLYNWINRKRILLEEKSTFHGYNTKDHLRHPPLELKLNALHRCFELGEDVQSKAVMKVFYHNPQRYGYRRIKIKLNKTGRILSEKVIRQIMNEYRLTVKGKSPKKFRFYLGEISPSVPDLIKRDFHAGRPDRKDAECRFKAFHVSKRLFS